MSNITLFLKTLLTQLVDGFKMKNPQAFAIVAAILYIIYAALDHLLGAMLIQDFSITLLGLEVYILDAIKNLIVALGFVVGAHTPPLPQAADQNK